MVIDGFRFAGLSAGIKGKGHKDLALICSDSPLSAAGVFTTNKIKAAPVLIDMERLKKGTARAVIVNSGNANACNGDAGIEDAVKTSEMTADELNIGTDEVLVSSTGVIGQRLPVDKIGAALPDLARSLNSESINDFAEAIMTTDSFPKVCFASKEAEGGKITVAGVAKGAGMIAPNMATLLAFILTDASIEPELLGKALKYSVTESFNCITVDGDMSTNDTVIALASGKSGVKIAEESISYGSFLGLMKEVMIKLAKMIVKDGEGATKLIEIRVKGALSAEEAKRAALTIANSSLVKTAFYGEDANWGRIAASLGGAGIEISENRLDLYFDEVQLVSGGLHKGPEAENKASEIMKKDELALTVDLNIGTHHATVWTCDLTHDYIRINAEYRS